MSKDRKIEAVSNLFEYWTAARNKAQQGRFVMVTYT